jgi:hypothetical protein
MTTISLPPPAAAADRIRQAVDERPTADYTFHFWSALGWTVLSLGLYSFYVFYQLMRRVRDHNRRRAALLAAAHDLAAERAAAQGKSEALSSALGQVQNDVQQLRAMDNDFRDPVLWLLACVFVNGLAWLAGAVLLDQDLIRHERHERAAAAALTGVFADLGIALPAPVAAAKQPHNYVGRIIAVVCSFGLYSLWWVADVMREGNANFQQDDGWEDALAGATAVAGPDQSA